MSPETQRLINTVGYIGTLPRAPGTWGSLAAMLVGWGIDRWIGTPFLVVATIVVTIVGFYTVGLALADRPGEDPSEFVIDEVAGQWVAMLFPALGFAVHGVPMVWPGPVFAFLLFRLFDIWKPWLVGRADRRTDPAGVMLDDLWAGLFAGICTVILAGLYHGIMGL
ncbi:phosphatidylglycerophosphatase A family protein [Paenirhodobacter enshiensis]|uniref:phosphatidylglycerophosphatase A family protein n=1 Tax=Paenirhodobacter enshiensis TaxID=1105367 RepID=UPI003FA26041